MESNFTWFGILFLVTLAAYWVPATIAVRRQHPNGWAIYLVNLLLGGTGIGWIGALIWSVLAIKDEERRKPGRVLIVVLVLSWIGTLAVFPAAVLAPMVSTQVLENADKAKVSVTRAQIQSLRTAVEQYRVDSGGYPTTDQGLAALLHKPAAGTIPSTWQGPYLSSDSVLLDGWKRPFLYTSDGQTFVLVSLGSDGIEGGTGANADIRSNDR